MLIRPLMLPVTLLVVLSACQSVGGESLSAVSVNESETSSKPRKREVPMRRHRFDETNRERFIEEHDMEGDERVSLVEFIAFREQRLTGGDSNGDGYLDEQEYVDEYVVRLDRRLEREREGHIEQTNRRFGALDRNDDGMIAREEFQASSDRIFSRLDPEGTGRIVYDYDAESDQDPRRGRRRSVLNMPTTHRLSGFMELYDVDASGVVTREQFDRLRDEQFETVDADADGVISPAEYVAEFETRLDRQAERVRDDQINRAHVRFGVVDLNDDGRIDLSEYLRVGLRTFNHWDITGTGVVSATDPVPEPASRD